MSKDFDKRISDIERQLFPQKINWGEWYDMSKEMHRTCGFSQMPDEEFDRMYEELYGSREDFIKDREEWAEKHGLYLINR